MSRTVSMSIRQPRGLIGALAAIVLVASLLVVLLPAAGAAPAEKKSVALLFVQAADRATTTSKNGVVTLTLYGMHPRTIYFSDRPDRITGHVSNAKFVKAWSKGGDSFKTDPPNAALEGTVGGKAHVTVVELRNPRLHGSTLRYTVRPVTPSGGLGHYGDRHNPVLPHALKAVTLFIDDYQGKALGATAPAPVTRVVDDDGRGTAADCNSATLTYYDIQTAVNASAAGDTIKLCPGLYAGGPANAKCQTTYPPCAEGQNAIVNKTLTIVGARSAQTTYVDQCGAYKDGGGANPSPVTDTIIQPLDPSLPTLSLQADNVVVRGIVLEQANQALSTSASFSGYTFDRNLIRDNNVGIQFKTSGLLPSSINGNCFQGNTTDVAP